MEKYVQSSELQCNVTSSPSDRPVICKQLSRRPHITVENVEAIERFKTSSNKIETYRMGDVLRNLSLNVMNLAEADRQFLIELATRGVQSYIYSSVPGSLFQHCPLIRGTGGDPTDGTYTGTVATGTTVYVPRGDASSVVWLEETDFANNPILIDGIDQQLTSAAQINSISRDMPLGRGYLSVSAESNYVKNSLFADDGTDIYNWTHSTEDGLTRCDTTGWMGVCSLWLWSVGKKWTSDSFSVATLADGDTLFLSAGWRTGGIMTFKFLFNNGVNDAEVNVDVSKGSGYLRQAVTIPLNIGGAGGTCVLEVHQNTGEFSEFCAPQVILGDTTYGGSKSYPVFIGGDGDGTSGAIRAQSMKFTGEWQAGMWTTGSSSDCMICASGYAMPTFDADECLGPHKIAGFEDSRTNKDSAVYLITSGSDLHMYIQANGTQYGNVKITGFERGNVLFIALYVGWDGGTYTLGAKVRIVGGSTTYTIADTTSNDKFVLFDTLWIGTDEDENFQSNCIHSDWNVWAGYLALITAQVAYMADEANLMEHRETLGRKYLLHSNMSPSPWNRQRLSGAIECENVEAL